MPPRLVGGLQVTAVLVAGLLGGLLALWGFSSGYRLSVGTISVSVSPFHRGALDLYVPLVDWGVRFPGVAFPARLNIVVQAVDRSAAADIAQGGLNATDALRAEARDAIASYLRLLAVLAGAASLALGTLTAAAIRTRGAGGWGFHRTSTDGPHSFGVRGLLGAAGIVAVGWVLAVAFLLAPRGDLPDPVYYAHGADIPVALEAIESAGRSSGQVSASFEEQIQGLARLVIDPAERPDLSGRPRLTVASDMHNNVLLESTLRRAAAGGPVLFVGDLTDTGSPLETSALRSVVRTGKPFLFVAGNHDSDTQSLTLAKAGAIVLTQRGRLLPSGRYGAQVVTVNGVRIAGYTSPNQRLAATGYRDRGADITAADKRAFAAWFTTIADRVDVVMVHEPALVAPVLDAFRAVEAEPKATKRTATTTARPRGRTTTTDGARPGATTTGDESSAVMNADETPGPALLRVVQRRGSRSLLFAVGHTHQPAVDSEDGVTEVNGGTIGAGGTGNLAEGQNASLAIVTYQQPPFMPLAVDLVSLNPGTGETTARRVRLGGDAVKVGDLNTDPPEGG